MAKGRYRRRPPPILLSRVSLQAGPHNLIMSTSTNPKENAQIQICNLVRSQRASVAGKLGTVVGESDQVQLLERKAILDKAQSELMGGGNLCVAFERLRESGIDTSLLVAIRGVEMTSANTPVLPKYLVVQETMESIRREDHDCELAEEQGLTPPDRRWHVVGSRRNEITQRQEVFSVARSNASENLYDLRGHSEAWDDVIEGGSYNRVTFPEVFLEKSLPSVALAVDEVRAITLGQERPDHQKDFSLQRENEAWIAMPFYNTSVYVGHYLHDCGINSANEARDVLAIAGYAPEQAAKICRQHVIIGEDRARMKVSPSPSRSAPTVSIEFPS